MRGDGVTLDALVIGGGFAGLSVAYHLERNGLKRVAVIERAPRLGAHASGNNAGMIRQAIADPAVAELARRGRASLASASRNGFSGFGFKANGSLLVARGSGLKELKRTAATLKRLHVGFRWMSKDRALRRVAALRSADFDRGLFCPGDAFVDIDRLLEAFKRRLSERKVPVHYGCALTGLKKTSDGFVVRAGGRTFKARRVVNAAGAWAGQVASMAGAARIPLKAYRRHLFFAKGLPPQASRWPFVWDVSSELYFRPYGRQWMLSACDKQLFRLGGRGISRGATVDPRVRALMVRKLRAFSPAMAGLKVSGVRAGLRTMAPDGKFVIGPDPKLKGFYWVAGLGGHGVTTSFSTGKLAADLIMKRKVDRKLERVFSPGRYAA